jgi:hypothetical protein
MGRNDGFGLDSAAQIVFLERDIREEVNETLGRMTHLTVVVTLDGARIKFKLPFDPPSVVIEGKKLTAESRTCTDYWERLK